MKAGTLIEEGEHLAQQHQALEIELTLHKLCSRIQRAGKDHPSIPNDQDVSRFICLPPDQRLGIANIYGRAARRLKASVVNELEARNYCNTHQ